MKNTPTYGPGSEPHSTDIPLLLTIKQVSKLTGISRSKLYEFLAAGDLPSVYIGASRRIRRPDLAIFLANLSQERPNP